MQQLVPESLQRLPPPRVSTQRVPESSERFSPPLRRDTSCSVVAASSNSLGMPQIIRPMAN